MSRAIYTFQREPTGHEYQAVVAAAARMSSHAVFVLRDEDGLTRAGEQLVEEFERVGRRGGVKTFHILHAHRRMRNESALLLLGMWKGEGLDPLLLFRRSKVERCRAAAAPARASRAPRRPAR
jgi:hypothetical protein